MSGSALRPKLSAFLIGSVFLGVVAGIFWSEHAVILKPLGDLFLNLLFTAAIPLIFFSVASAVCSMENLREFGVIGAVMALVFLLTGIVASLLMIFSTFCFPPHFLLSNALPPMEATEQVSLFWRLVQALSVGDFIGLFSREHLLALIVFSLLVGLSAAATGDRGKPFSDFLASANEVMMKLIGFIMFYAPVGLFSYFAYLTGSLGPEFLGPYGQSILIYYLTAFLYFFLAFSAYAWFCGGKESFRLFWKNIMPTAVTALGTGSSVAAIPLNLRAADRAGVPRKVSEIVIPIGATVHMEGSCLSAILKITLLSNLYGIPLNDPGSIAAAIGIALISATVMSGIPGGGLAGEMMIISFYGFPPEALAIIASVGILVDPPATMVNAAGDNAASMMIARILYGKKGRVIS